MNDRAVRAGAPSPGERFGMLTVIGPAEKVNERSASRCRCDCGRERVVRNSVLKRGRAWSCGCKTRHGHTTMIDLAGKRFGKLTALYATDKRDPKGAVCWVCRCDCGNTAEVFQDRLVSGNTTSCGCRKQELNSHVNQLLHFVDGTCVEWLQHRKSRSDNTSGFRGVSRVGDRYRAYIGFRGQRYYLGWYRDFDKAREARLEAEQLLHENFVEQWNSWHERAERDAGWAEQHPFSFTAAGVQGRLIIKPGPDRMTDNR